MPFGVTVTPVKIAATAILILASILFLVENRQRLKKTETKQEIIQKKSRRYTAGKTPAIFVGRKDINENDDIDYSTSTVYHYKLRDFLEADNL